MTVAVVLTLRVAVRGVHVSEVRAVAQPSSQSFGRLDFAVAETLCLLHKDQIRGYREVVRHLSQCNL